MLNLLYRMMSQNISFLALNYFLVFLRFNFHFAQMRFALNTKGIFPQLCSRNLFVSHCNDNGNFTSLTVTVGNPFKDRLFMTRKLFYCLFVVCFTFFCTSFTKIFLLLFIAWITYRCTLSPGEIFCYHTNRVILPMTCQKITLLSTTIFLPTSLYPEHKTVLWNHFDVNNFLRKTENFIHPKVGNFNIIKITAI